METAVQWLLERVEDVDLTPKMWEQIKLTALKKEKEQIVEAVEFGLFNMHTTIDGEKYYLMKY